MNRLKKYNIFKESMKTHEIDLAIIEWLDKHKHKYLKLRTIEAEHIEEIIQKIINEYNIPLSMRRYVSRSVKNKLGLDYTKNFESMDIASLDKILPNRTSDGYNNLQYTRTDFLKMLKQVLDFYYDEFGMKFLGYGADGDAFKITSKDGDIVLKITKNQEEASAVEKVRKYNISGSIDYYDVRKINDNEDIYDTLYAIMMDNVESLNKLEKSAWTFLRGYFFNFNEFEKTSMMMVSGDKINYQQFLKTNSISRLNSVYQQYKSHRETKKLGFGIDQIYSVYDDVDHSLMLTEEAYKTILKLYDTFCNLVRDCVKYNLKLKDLHTDNIGKKDGEFKFFDVLYDERPIELRLKSINISL